MHIHLLSNSPRLNSGFSVVAKNLAIGLKQLGHEITYTGMQTVDRTEFYQNIEILPIGVGYLDDVTSYMIALDRLKPDVVINIFQADFEYNDFPKMFKRCLWYIPVEGRNMPQKMANDILQIKTNGGKPVAQCRYGQSEMQSTLGCTDISYIYHGFDDKIYKPIDVNKKEEITYCYYKTENGKASSNPLILHKNGCYDCLLSNKESISCPNYKEEHIAVLKLVNGKWTEEDMPITHLPVITKGKYVFLFVGQNLGVRKRIERLLKAYSIFVGQSKQLKDRTILHLHTMPISINGTNLIGILTNLGLQENVIFSYGAYRSSGWTDEGMNVLYNIADVNISASSSEGYGLATLESMACGIPNIGPDCSSFTELIEDGEKDPNARGLLALIGEWQMIENGSERALVSEQHLAAMMKKLYSDEKLAERFSKNAIKFANQYTWEKICLEWSRLLNNMK
jgi:glycosyltransferase involved in cell wall biosynthesis